LILPSSTKRPSSVELRAIGSILHDFYSGIEKVFKRIALEIDGEIPKGEDWHIIHLLNRMAIRVPQVRPNVISSHLRDDLEDYLRFRLLFRHLYGFELKWSRCQALALNMPDILNHFLQELEEFLKFLESLSEHDKREE